MVESATACERAPSASTSGSAARTSPTEAPCTQIGGVVPTAGCAPNRSPRPARQRGRTSARPPSTGAPTSAVNAATLWPSGPTRHLLCDRGRARGRAAAAERGAHLREPGELVRALRPAEQLEQRL